MYVKDRLRRSMMFVPGNNPGMIRDAHIYGADSIMFDLEDSVAYTEKDAARFLVYNALKTLHFGTKETVVRINDLSSGLGVQDLEAVVRAGVQVVRLPKTDSAQDVIDCEREIQRIERQAGIPVGATGMTSRFFENTVAEIMTLAGEDSPLALRRALARSRMLSSDVSAGFDPGYAGKFETKNAAFMGRGLCFNKYTGSRGKGGSNDADAEYVALIRDIMDEAGVDFQTCELGRVNAGGGGTIAYIMAKYGMNVIDSGVAVLSMHALWEVANKADIYEAYRGYKAFIERA